MHNGQGKEAAVDARDTTDDQGGVEGGDGLV